jgi:type IV pilus assembly protein PilY1
MHWSTVTGFDGTGFYTDNGTVAGRGNTHAYYSSNFNKIYYNPSIVYSPAVNSLGTPLVPTLLGNNGTPGNAPPTAAPLDPFPTLGKTNAVADLTPQCRAAATPVLPSYTLTLASDANNNLADYPTGVAVSAGNNTNCSAAGVPNRARIAFYYRATPAAINNTIVGNNLLRATPADGDFLVADRVDIIPGRTYPVPSVNYPSNLKTPSRTDCAGTSCTYNEEIQNFANWFSYYRTRISMTKSSLGRVFAGLDTKFRVGFNAINNANTNNQTAGLDGPFWQNIRTFDATQKLAWFNTLYAIYPGNSTPLLNQTIKIGEYFKGKLANTVDPVQFSCQSNYHILSTDGFWNDGINGVAGPSITVGNTDGNSADTFSTAASGSLDRTNTANTLADYAMYYYKTDLRSDGTVDPTGKYKGVANNFNNCINAQTGVNVCANNVKANSKDSAAWQHINMFTIGLGASGSNLYPAAGTALTANLPNIPGVPAYEILSNPFYAGNGYDPTFWMSRMKLGNTVLTNNWSQAVGNTPTTIDDLWHAAINSRGTYLNAGDPSALTSGLSSILSDIGALNGAGSGAALSTNDLRGGAVASGYPVTYDDSDWSGDIAALEVKADVNGGLTAASLLSAKWHANALLDAQVAGNGWKDNRRIFTIGKDNKPGPFVWDKLSPTQQTALGTKEVLAYLRGQANPLYRARKHVLGDIVGSEATYITKPLENYSESNNPGYEVGTPTKPAFKEQYKNRAPMLYVGANDGMMHAFNADLDTTNGGGQEAWAYIPTPLYQGPTINATYPNGKPTEDGLAALAQVTYAHRFYVNATPYVKDADFARAGVDPKSVPTATYDWHSLLVGGLGKGGSGYYALDVTDPSGDASTGEQTLADKKVLWEFKDPDMGFTYGEPLITKTRKWGWVVIVSSGYNNISGPNPGQGFLYILNAKTGALLQKIGTGVGTAANPSGLTHFTGWTTNEADWTSEQLYAGDLFGNVWRFDVSQQASVAADFPAPVKFAVLTDSANKPQPITTTPVVALATNNVDRYVFVGTGKLLGPSDLTDANTQSIYAFRDGGKYAPSVSTTGLSFPLGRSALAQNNNLLLGAATSTSLGWYVDLSHDNPADLTTPAERVIVNPVATNGTVSFVTATPTSGSNCSASNKGSAFGLAFANGKSRLVDSVTKAAVAKIENPIDYTKVQIIRVNGKLRAIATDSVGNIVNVGGGPLGDENGEGRPHRYYWREILQ